MNGSMSRTTCSSWLCASQQGNYNEARFFGPCAVHRIYTDEYGFDYGPPILAMLNVCSVNTILVH